MPGATSGYAPIADYAFLADCHSAALLSREGSIDWACLRRFDAGSVFARLLDQEAGGHFSIVARDVVERRRAYVDGSLVVTSEVVTRHGRARTTDAFGMRPGGADDPLHRLVRVVEGVEGEVTFDVELRPRFDYGELRPWLRTQRPGVCTAVGGDDALVIASDHPFELDRQQATLRAEVTLSAGQRSRWSLTSQPAHRVDPDVGPVDETDELVEETLAWWRRWSSSTRAPEGCRDLVRNSAAVLKGLTCAPSGALIAAPTTSLPERIGGSRNWDYRYSWVRDSTMALDALARAGHREVAGGFRDFLLRSAAGHADDLQIMYGAYGERRLVEQVLGLSGYRDSAPVRIGNDAATQTQHDVYGHILSAAHLWHDQHEAMEPDEWRFLAQLVDAAAQRWRRPDRGLWEIRGDPQHFVQSKVMMWVALDRGIRLVEDGLSDDEAKLPGWRDQRSQLREAIETHGVDRDRGCYVQTFGGRALDASLLTLPLVGYEEPSSPRMRATVDAVVADLGDETSTFLRRYDTDGSPDGLDAGEGRFLLCSFWLVSVLALQGRVDAARQRFERLLGAGNDLGLFAEEYDPAEGILLGNFPQAFTHLGLMQAAFHLQAADAGAAPRHES